MESASSEIFTELLKLWRGVEEVSEFGDHVTGKNAKDIPLVLCEF